MEIDIDNDVLIGNIKIENKKVPIYLNKDIKDAFDDIQLLAKLMNYDVEQIVYRFMYEISVKFNFNKNGYKKFCVIFEYIRYLSGCSLEQMHITIDNEDNEDYGNITVPNNNSYNEKEKIICAIKELKKLI